MYGKAKPQALQSPQLGASFGLGELHTVTTSSCTHDKNGPIDLNVSLNGGGVWNRHYPIM